MSRRLRWFLVCLPLLLAAGVSYAVGYQPNFIRNLIGPVTVTGDLSVTDDLTVTDDAVIGDDATVTTLTFSGGGTPCLTRGGNTTVQTCSGDGFASLGPTQMQSTGDVWDSLRNSANGATCSGQTGSVCVNDTGGLAIADGAGTTVAVLSAAGLVSGDTGIASGAFGVQWMGGAAAPEGANGQGGYRVTTIGRGSRVGTVTCSCRVAGSGGTNGIFISLMECNTDGSACAEAASVEVAGADTNACDDAAGTQISGNIATSIAATKVYTAQVKNSTDCAGNPTDCQCNFEILR